MLPKIIVNVPEVSNTTKFFHCTQDFPFEDLNSKRTFLQNFLLFQTLNHQSRSFSIR